MAIRNIGNSSPSHIGAGRFFTMSNVNEANDSANGAVPGGETTITNLITPGSNGAQYLPSNPNSLYAVGAINARLYGPAEVYQGWPNAVPISNNAIINQAEFMNSMGSLAMSFNLSENMRILRRTLGYEYPGRAARDQIFMSLEMERAICESAIRTPVAEDFVNTTIETYQELSAQAELLGRIYDELQFLRQVWNEGFDPIGPNPDWDLITAGINPMTRIGSIINPEPVDPLASTRFTAMAVTPAPLAGMSFTTPMVMQYTDTSAVRNNAIAVNTLVVTGMHSTGGPASRVAPSPGASRALRTGGLGRGY